MGDPKRLRRKWKRPRKTFNTARIAADKELKRDYGFRRKKEIWRLDYAFKHLMRRARKILATKDKEAEEILMNKLIKMGLIEKKVHIEEVLNMTFEDLCERRLQTILFKKGLATTLKQARQFIAHKKVRVGEKMVNQPNYIVLKDEEDKIKLKEKKVKVVEKPKEDIKEEPRTEENVPEGENTETETNETPVTEKSVEEMKEDKTEEIKEKVKKTKPEETETKENKPVKETKTKEKKEETKEEVKETEPIEKN